MRNAWVLGLLLLTMSSLSVPVTSAHGIAAPSASPAAPLVLPSGLFQAFESRSTCDRSSSVVTPASLINVPAAGTGASATYNLDQLSDNTAVNATVDAPSGASLSTDQYILLGVGDPINSTAFTAVGIAETYYLIVTIAAPAAYLPNGTIVVNPSNTVSQGSTNTVEIDHVAGYWWSYTYNGKPITGSSLTSTAWATNGTYNLGVSVASGALCEEGYTVGPSFVAIAYGSGTAATPSIPTTSVPWAIGVEPQGSSSTSYTPAAANAIPQFNASLGVVGLQAHNQLASLGTDHLKIGSSVAFPGSFASLWGAFKVVTLNSSSVSPVSASLAYNGHQQFNTTALDQYGSPLPGVTYAWQISPASLGTLNTTTGPTATLTAGSTTVSGSLWVNMSYNCSRISNRATITVTPTGGPSITSFVASPTSILVGGTTYLNVTNGTWPRPITYHYTGLPPGCSSSNTTSLLCSPSANGTYDVRVYLNDSLGHSSNSLLLNALNVYSPVAILSFTASPSSLTVNTTTSVSVVATGGIPSLTYDYTGLPSGCSDGLQHASFTCVPNVAGTYVASVFVNDSAGHSVTSTVSIKVNVGLAISSFTASPTAGSSPGTIPYGGTTYLNVTPLGGTPPYTFFFYSLPAGCTTSSVDSLACTPTTSGSFLVEVDLNDSSGATAHGAALLVVSPPPNPVITSFTASPNPVNVSQTTTITALAIGGSGTLKYGYTGLPTGCASTLATFACTPTQAETYSVTVTVTDANSNTATKTLSLVVNAVASSLAISSFTATPSSIANGSSTSISVVTTGSAGTLSYTYVGLPAGCSSANLATISCSPTASGTFTIRVYVNGTDPAGASATDTLVLTVSPSSPAGSSGSSGGLGGSLTLILLAVVAVAAVAVVAVIVIRKRKQSVPPPTGPQPWTPGPGAPGGEFTEPAAGSPAVPAGWAPGPGNPPGT